MPFALEAAACVLYASEATEIMPQMIPGLMSPNLGLPYPSIDGSAQKNKGLVLVVYGGAASSGIMTTQLATASGISVVAVAGKGSVKICTSAGATSVIDRSGGEEVVKGVVAAVKDIIGGDGAAAGRFVGIFDAISTPETHAHDIAILAALADSDGKFAAPVHLACTNPPPSEGLPENVKAGMIFAVSDVATPIWETFVGPALEKGIIKCLPPPNVVGKGLEFVQEAPERSEKGVNATKLVVEL